MNLRRRRRQIYSLFPLTTREPHHFISCGARDRSRTRDPLITNQLLYQLSYSGPLQSLSSQKVTVKPPWTHSALKSVCMSKHITTVKWFFLFSLLLYVSSQWTYILRCSRHHPDKDRPAALNIDDSSREILPAGSRQGVSRYCKGFGGSH